MLLLRDDPSYWDMISSQGLQRIYECYTWKIYANKVLNMGCIYSFWRGVNNMQKQAKLRYIQTFYNLQYRNLMKGVSVKTDETLKQQIKEKPKPLEKPRPQVVKCVLLLSDLILFIVQPGTFDFPIQCLIKRDRKNAMFYMYLALSLLNYEIGKYGDGGE